MIKRIIATLSLVSLIGIPLALKTNKQIKADEKPPIVIQVENHEQRIGDLETKTDATQTQVNQNSADIKVLGDKTGTPPAPKVDPVVTPVAQPQPTTQTTVQTTIEPTPESQPAPNPRTITSVADVLDPQGPGTEPTHTCRYKVVFDNGKYEYVDVRYASNPCLQVGDLYPYSIPGMY